MAKRTASEDLYFEETHFRSMTAITPYQLRDLEAKYPEARKTDLGYPVFGVLSAVWQEKARFEKLLGTNSKKDDKEIALDLYLKRENILSKQILNQMKLGLLIKKEDATKRIQKVLTSVMRMILNGIKEISSGLINNKENFQSQREVEIFIHQKWNEAIDLLKDKSIVQNWDLDGSKTLLATRLIGEDEEDEDEI